MGDLIAIIIIAVAAAIVALPIVSLILAGLAHKRAKAVANSAQDLLNRIANLEKELLELRRRIDTASTTPSVPQSAQPVSRAEPESIESARVPATPRAASAQIALEQQPTQTQPPVAHAEQLLEKISQAVQQPPEQKLSTAPKDRAPTEPVSKPFWAPLNWEQFLGVKLFAWAAGLALFLGVGFFLKWSFDRGLITPPVRVAMGFVTGIGLLVTGLRIPRQRYNALAQAFIASGVVVLYADIFASCAFYHFIPNAAAFLLMVLVTVTAFLLAVRLDAPVVAILGLLGGFLTPPLLSTGEDQPFGLFGYIALLDIGLLAVALNKRWNYMTFLGALATVAMQFGWVHRFFVADKMPVATAVFLVFPALFTAAAVIAHHLQLTNRLLTLSAIILPLAAHAFGLYVQIEPFTAVVSRPVLFFVLVFGADVALLVLAAVQRELRMIHLLAGGLVFFQLIYWTSNFLRPAALNLALGAYLLFGIVHAVFPVVLERLNPSGRTVGWAHVFAPLALLLLMLPMFELADLTLLIWPTILAIDILAVAIAFLTASALAIISVLLLTGLATAFWTLKMPATLAGLPEVLCIIGATALLFFVVGIFVARRMHPATAQSQGAKPKSWFPAPPQFRLPPTVAQALIPATSAMLPFVLLTLLTLRLPLTDPSPVFGLAALMVVLLLGLVRFYQADWVSLAGLIGTVMLEAVWHTRHVDADNALTSLTWYVGFYFVFGLFPFIFKKHVQHRLGPWLTSALVGPGQFYLVYWLVKLAYPNNFMGVIPALFALPSLLALVHLVKTLAADAPWRNTQLALFGGVALFFITLIFPIQFEKQWITIGWALEGVGLLWLFHRVPHNGLKYLGAALLVTAFVRLALNPAVLEYHPRTPTPVLNWYLYAYGIVTICLFAGARLLSEPHNTIGRLNIRAVLAGLGGVLGFLLVNIQIADYFSTGTTITFKFSGDFARDMTYSLAWGAYAFVVLLVGILRNIRGARFAGLGLLILTLLKLFLHDLWNLGGLYRIGSLIGLALVLISVSYLYQRHIFPKTERQQSDQQ